MGFLIASRIPGDPISSTSLALGANRRNVTLRSECTSGETGSIVGVLVERRRAALAKRHAGRDAAENSGKQDLHRLSFRSDHNVSFKRDLHAGRVAPCQKNSFMPICMRRGVLPCVVMRPKLALVMPLFAFPSGRG